jgi:hypothetical protein
MSERRSRDCQCGSRADTESRDEMPPRGCNLRGPDKEAKLHVEVEG